MTTLAVYIDFKSPGSYLAIAPALAFARDNSVALRWLPLPSRQETIPARKTNETRGETHRRVRALARQRVHLRYASLRGLTMRFLEQPGETDLALAALFALQDRALPFIHAAFSAYWVEHRDLNSPDVVEKLLNQAGTPLASSELDKALAALGEVTQEARALGVADTPAFVFADQVFQGREHLGVIAELLADTGV